MITKLAAVSIKASCFVLPEKIYISKQFTKQEKELFQYFIRQGARLSRLDLLKKQLQQEMDRNAILIGKAESLEERIEVKAYQVMICKKMDKLSCLLERSWEDLLSIKI